MYENDRIRFYRTPIKFFLVGRIFYWTIHAAGMKERKGEMEKRAKDFSPLREIGMWTHFLPIDSDLKA